MRIDTLQQYVTLRRQLSQEREQLAGRLGQINDALGELSAVAPAPSPAEPEPSPTQQSKLSSAGPGRSAGGGGMSLREHVLEVLRSGAKTKEEVLEAVQERGYRFQTKDPLNSLGVILYGKNPKFNRADGRFSLGGQIGRGRTEGANSSGGKRQMSPAARARIAAAQRARWAASRGQAGGAVPKAATPQEGKPRFSAAARAAIAEAARKRWAAAKRAGRNSL